MSTPFNLNRRFKVTYKPKQPDGKDESGFLINIDELLPFFIEECSRNFIAVTPYFARNYLYLLLNDSEYGLGSNASSKLVSICKIEKFLSTAIEKYKNPIDATVSCMKMSYYCRNSKDLDLNFISEKYQSIFDQKIKQLVDGILQYPENSNAEQLQEMFLKMQVLIITNYQLGHPENYMLLNKCRAALKSILGKGDIQSYVLKKKYHRLEYLQKLCATAAGIIIFTNQGPGADRENMRNIFVDLEMGIRNTKESLKESLDRVLRLKQKASLVMLELIEINVAQKTISYLRPHTHVREMNTFVALFEVYNKYLEKIKTVLEKTYYLIEVYQKKFNCVIEKINEVLKYRSAIESELIFPHFAYLSEIWNAMMLHLNHLVEINKIKDHLDDLLSEKLENKFNELYDDLRDKSKYVKQPIKYTFRDIINSISKCQTSLSMLKIKQFAKNYCALTMVLTGGFIVPSKFEKKLCENISYSFGFSSKEYAKFVEHSFKDISKFLHATIPTCSDLIMLFELDEEIMNLESDLLKHKQTKKTLETQTEMMLPNEIPQKNQTNGSWNVWDFHRQTIKLANIRKRQTNLTQTNLTYSTRNAQNECDVRLNSATQI